MWKRTVVYKELCDEGLGILWFTSALERRTVKVVYVKVCVMILST